MLIKLPTMEYVASKNRPFAASSGCLPIKDRNPNEVNPSAKTSNPALVDNLSRCLGIFIAKIGIFSEVAASFVSRGLLLILLRSPSDQLHIVALPARSWTDRLIC
jgi:hypothetical protein